MSCQWPKTVPTAALSRQPRADSRPPRAAVSAWGSSRRGRAGQDGDAGAWGAAPVRSGCWWFWLGWRGAAPGRSPLAQASARARASASAASRARSWSGRVGTCRVRPGAAADIEVGAGEDARDDFRYRGGDQDLLGGGDQGGEAVAAARV